MKKYTLLCLAILSYGFTLGQTLKQTRTCSRIFTNNPERWLNLDWQNVVLDDNKYVSTVKRLGGTSWPIEFLDFKFSIPAEAIIEKIDVKMIRYKSGKNKVIDSYCALVTGTGEYDHGGAFPNMAKTTYWPVKEETVIYNMPVSGVGTTGYPYQWTPSMVNAPYFGVFFDIGFVNGGSGSIAYIEQVEITVNYTLPTTKIAESNFINLKQHSNLVTVTTKHAGKYKLTVTDRFGRTLQQNILRNGMNEQVQLNSRCKGYCVITVEGNGQKKSMQVFIH